MNNISNINQQTEKLKSLIEEGSLEEARSSLNEILKSDITSEERGEILAQFAKAYMEVKLMINKEYEKVLDNTIATLKELKKDEEEMIREVAEGSA